MPLPTRDGPGGGPISIQTLRAPSAVAGQDQKFTMGMNLYSSLRLLCVGISWSIFILPFSCSLTKSCLTFCDPMDCSLLGSSVFCYLLKFAQIHVHWVNDATCLTILSSAALFSFCLHSFPGSRSFQWVGSLHSGGQSIEVYGVYLMSSITLLGAS